MSEVRDCLDNPVPEGTTVPAGAGPSAGETAATSVLPPGVAVSQSGVPKPITWRVLSGNHARLTAQLMLADRVTPATPANSLVYFNLAETQFCRDLIWQGLWRAGITERTPGSGIVNVDIPDAIMNRLREGSYAFSMMVADRLGVDRYTALMGAILVEYTVGGPQHDIPYQSPNPGEYQVLSFVNTKFTGRVYYYNPQGDVRWFNFVDGMFYPDNETSG